MGGAETEIVELQDRFMVLGSREIADEEEPAQAVARIEPAFGPHTEGRGGKNQRLASKR
jgi:hypothetical protein